METTTEIGEYKGHELLSIIETDSDKYPTKLSFGKKKAKMILSQLEAIKAFAEEDNESAEPRATAVPLPPNLG